jgi:6,7-dimethyl-8-ribityllumazine synthase
MRKPHIMVVEARFYEDIADALYEGALGALEDAGATHERFEVSGAFELPAAIAFAHRADPARFDGYVALGCVIRGETTHYDYVCAESARGLQDLAVRENLAIGYGVLTVENHEQAWARASTERKNKGRDVANACLAMIALRNALNQGRK